MAAYAIAYSHTVHAEYRDFDAAVSAGNHLVEAADHQPFGSWHSVLASVPMDTAALLHLAQIWSRPLVAIGVTTKAAVGAAIAMGLCRSAQNTPPPVR